MKTLLSCGIHVQLWGSVQTLELGKKYIIWDLGIIFLVVKIVRFTIRRIRIVSGLKQYESHARIVFRGMSVDSHANCVIQYLFYLGILEYLHNVQHVKLCRSRHVDSRVTSPCTRIVCFHLFIDSHLVLDFRSGCAYRLVARST